MMDEQADDERVRLEDENEDEDTVGDAYGDESVFVQFRARGTRGPLTASGNRGRVCWEGEMPRAVVAHLQRLRLGPDAGLCEPISIWMNGAPGAEQWVQVNSTAQSPGQRQDRIDRAQQEHEQQMQAVAAQLRDVRGEHRDVEMQLEFLKRRMSLEQSTLERMQQEIETVRAALEGERRRCDEERELLKEERAHRVQERAILAQQDAAERQMRQEQAAKAVADIQALVGSATEQYRITLDTNKATISALKEGLTAEVAATKGLIQQEQTLQQIIQTSKLNAVDAVAELRTRLETSGAPQAPAQQQPIPYLELMDRALAGLGMGLTIATGKTLPGT